MFLDLSLRDQCASIGLDSRTAPAVRQIILPRLAGDEGEVAISIVCSAAQRSDASALINRMYSWRGYGDDHSLADRAEQTTFAVSSGGQTIGTLTLTVDSEAGLATDSTFRDELNTYRRMPGANICELTRFAFDASNPSKRLLASLFHVVFMYGEANYGCTDLFIEVAQRHRRFYEAMLGFERVCPLKTNDSVGVPSQLMRLGVSDIQGQIDTHRDKSDDANCRSLYPFFFSKDDEKRISRELALASQEVSRSVSRDYLSFKIAQEMRAMQAHRGEAISPAATPWSSQ